MFLIIVNTLVLSSSIDKKIIILQEVHRLSDRFEMVQFQHIYHERNNLANSLAKEGARICEGHWLIKEQREDSFYETYQVFLSDYDDIEFFGL